jgi:YgiT-type zinc finger domain-containing protein
MKCMICKKGESLPGKVTVTLERNGTTLIVKSVPALVCENCGEEYVDEKVTSELLRVSGKAVREGVQVDVREYVSA